MKQILMILKLSMNYKLHINLYIYSPLILDSLVVYVYSFLQVTFKNLVVNFRKILLSKGIYLNVLELMKKHLHSPEVAESGCKMLNHLFEGR